MSTTVANIDLTDAIRFLGLKAQVTLARASGGVWVDGRYAVGAGDSVSFTATVQSFADENQSLPEAVRTKRLINVWSTSELRPTKRGDGTPGDVITWNGSPYEVYDFWDRSTDGSFWKALCVAVDQ